MSDLISRQAAIDALGDEGLITAMCVIARVPTVQPERLTNVIESIRLDAETKYMELYEVWNQLDSIANHSRSMIEEPGDIWSEDLKACRIAQVIIEKIMRGMQEDNKQ